MKKFFRKVVQISGGNLELEEIPDDYSGSDESEGEFLEDNESEEVEKREDTKESFSYLNSNVTSIKNSKHVHQDSVDALFLGSSTGNDFLGFGGNQNQNDDSIDERGDEKTVPRSAKNHNYFGKPVLPMVTMSQLQNRKIGNLFSEKKRIDNTEEQENISPIPSNRERNQNEYLQQSLPIMQSRAIPPPIPDRDRSTVLIQEISPSPQVNHGEKEDEKINSIVSGNGNEISRNNSRSQWEQKRQKKKMNDSNQFPASGSQSYVKKFSSPIISTEETQIVEKQEYENESMNRVENNQVPYRRIPPPVMKKERKKRIKVVDIKPRRKPPPPPPRRRQPITRLVYHRESLDNFTTGKLQVFRVEPNLNGNMKTRTSNIILEEDITRIPTPRSVVDDLEEDMEEDDNYEDDDEEYDTSAIPRHVGKVNSFMIDDEDEVGEEYIQMMKSVDEIPADEDSYFDYGEEYGEDEYY